MPKYLFQWKDPDFYDNERHFRKERGLPEISEEEWRALTKLGIGEYLRVEVDTDAGLVKVLTPGKW